MTSNPIPPECKVLEKDVGTWTADLIIRPGPGAPENTSRGVAVSRLIAGGRWLVTDFRVDGNAFEGHGVMGFDPTRGCYVYTWVDTMRPFLAVGEGTWDPHRRIMTIMTEARIGDRVVRWRESTETLDDDTQVFRSFMPGPDGREHEMMTGTYRRKR